MLGPEAPLIALGSALGLLSIRLLRRDAPNQVQTVVAAAGTFAALSLIFASPLIAAVILIEATGLGGPRLPLILLPGLLAAGTPASALPVKLTVTLPRVRPRRSVASVRLVPSTSTS